MTLETQKKGHIVWKIDERASIALLVKSGEL